MQASARAAWICVAVQPYTLCGDCASAGVAAKIQEKINASDAYRMPGFEDNVMIDHLFANKDVKRSARSTSKCQRFVASDVPAAPPIAAPLQILVFSLQS
jgi:hypothetical protein